MSLFERLCAYALVDLLLSLLHARRRHRGF